jgi:hypothetical protein
MVEDMNTESRCPRRGWKKKYYRTLPVPPARDEDERKMDTIPGAIAAVLSRRRIAGKNRNYPGRRPATHYMTENKMSDLAQTSSTARENPDEKPGKTASVRKYAEGKAYADIVLDDEKEVLIVQKALLDAIEIIAEFNVDRFKYTLLKNGYPENKIIRYAEHVRFLDDTYGSGKS